MCHSFKENQAILAAFNCTSLSSASETESVIFDTKLVLPTLNQIDKHCLQCRVIHML